MLQMDETNVESGPVITDDLKWPHPDLNCKWEPGDLAITNVINSGDLTLTKVNGFK